MKKKHRSVLEKIPGFTSESGTLRLRAEAAERVGRDYDQIQERAYPPMDAATRANLISNAAQSQNQMLEMLKPMVEGILNDPKDPRSNMMQQMLSMFGELPDMHNVDAIRSDILQNESMARLPVPQSQGQDDGITVVVDDDSTTPADSAAWLSGNFGSLMPGLIEAARYAYARLKEDPLNAAEAAAYLVENPSDQDFLNRVRIQSVNIGADRRYVFSLETPCAHFEEHGMYAVFQEDKLIACGEYDAIADLEDDEDDF